MQLEHGKIVITTNGPEVLCIPPQDTSNLSPCDHEEADTRMILHLSHAFHEGFQNILIRTVDTDVVVLTIAAVSKLGIQESWVAFGTGKNFRYIPVHEIAASLGPNKCQALPMFHAYTGCDTVSAFYSKGKKSAWETWKVYEDVTMAFITLSLGPSQILDNELAVLERFTILLYDHTSTMIDVDQARQVMFTKKGSAMDAIPPTRAALLQHTKRAVYQGGHCWGKALEVCMEMPSPDKWGWTDPPNWRPMWTSLPEANKSSRELIRCGCTKGCRGRCNCRKAALKCTSLCQPCGGQLCEV
ncbi:uncharacterized protein [Apostichopus japonicus]|uniref:uncharacterized protein n=1 Tax=Stichopus japonicus TaxID=307972 RepID=UPI003AB530F4